MKPGRAPTCTVELARVRTARECIGGNVELFVDANGAYERKEALTMAERFAGFEEPASSDGLEGRRLLRDRGPAGEYGCDLFY